jgi:hypothetical protein
MMSTTKQAPKINIFEQARKEGRGVYSNVKDPSLAWQRRALNARVFSIPLGVEGDANSPIPTLIWINAGAGDPTRGRHSHACDAINLVVEGSMYMDGFWLTPGQAKIVPAGHDYGDAVSPDGVLFIEIFGDHQGAKPEYFDSEHMAYWDSVHGNIFDFKREE